MLFAGLVKKITPCRPWLAAILLLATLAACETTTTGGFNPEADQDQALLDYVQLAVAYYDANDMAGARRHLNNALAIDPRSADAYNVLALILQREGDLELADETFRRAIGLDRTNSRVRNNYAAFLFSQERYPDAFEQLQLVANDSTYEGRAIAFENLGRSALMLGEIDEAQRAFERALQINNNLYISSLELARIRIDKQDWTGARQAFQQFLTIREFYSIPFDARSLWIGIQLENNIRNREQMALYVRLLTALYPDSPEYQLYRSLADG
ncbi:MAG: type IV pilus biogenesis/stability protein PilW [Pseudohongiellaceae bacterium]